MGNLLRAKQTAEILNDNHLIIFDDRLIEREHGNLEGKSITATDREEYWNYYTNVKYGTEERIPALFKIVVKQKDY